MYSEDQTHAKGFTGNSFPYLMAVRESNGPNLRIISIEEEIQLKGPGNVFSKTIEENFPNLKMEIAIKIQ